MMSILAIATIARLAPAPSFDPVILFSHPTIFFDDSPSSLNQQAPQAWICPDA